MLRNLEHHLLPSLNCSIPCARVPLSQGHQAALPGHWQCMCVGIRVTIPWACGMGGVHAKSPKSMELWRCEGGREKSELKAI